MSKLKLKRIKEQDKCAETYPENMKNNSNSVDLQKNLNMQHLFVDKSPSENTDRSRQSSIINIQIKDHKTSKYFITSSLPELDGQMDESEVEFQPEKRTRRKAVTPQKEVRKKNKPLKKRIQKDIRDVMNSKKDDLLKYTQQFERECAARGVDVNPENLQLAIALSRSLTDFRRSENDQDITAQNSLAETELTSSQETAFEKKRIISIRKTLDEFGFKVRRVSDNAIVKPNVKKKRIKGCCNYPLLIRTQTEKCQRITDLVSQILFQSVTNIPHNSKLPNNIPTGVSLNEIWCEGSCIFTKSCHAYSNIRENDVFYTSNLMTHSVVKVGCLLKDWGSIPGREKSPERFNDQLSDFRESEIYLNNFDVLLSGTCSVIIAEATKLSKPHTSNSSASEFDDRQNFSHRKFIEEIDCDVSRCSSPDLFGDDTYCEDNIFLDNNQKPETVKEIPSIVVNDSSDDELPRVYISKSQKEFKSTLPNISEDCLEDINTLDCGKNTHAEVMKHQTPEESFDLTQDDSENSLSNQNHLINVSQKSNNELDKIKDVEIIKTADDVSHTLESGDSITNTSGNLNLSEVYEGRNGIIHYESFQMSPVSSMSIKNSFKKSFYIDSSGHSSEEDIFESTQIKDKSFNLDGSNTRNTKSIIETKDISYHLNETTQKSPQGIDLTQSLKDSDTSFSPSYTPKSKTIDKHVSCQSMLIANRLSFGMNNTENLNVPSNEKSESVHLQCSSIIQNSEEDIDLTISPNDNCSNISIAYSLNYGNDDKHVSCQSKLHSSTITAPLINSSSIEKSMNELSTEISACNDIFVISDEEFNYSMSTPYSKNEKLFRKKNISKRVNCKNVSYVLKNHTASMHKINDESNESADHSCEKQSVAAVTCKEIAVTTDNKIHGSAYNLDLGGSSIFDRIPSCNSSFLGNYIMQNKGDDASNRISNFYTPCATENNALSDFNDIDSDNIKQTRNKKCNEILSNLTRKNRISAICSTTPDHSEYLIETNNVTPVQDFNKLDTPKMLKELSRFGLKPLKRKRAVQLLEHIYNETHPLLPSKLPPKKRRRLKDKDDICSSSTNEHESDTEINVENMSPKNAENYLQFDLCQTENHNAEKSSESNENEDDTQDNSIIYLPDLKKITIKQINCDPKDWIFQNREKAKIHSCRVPLHIAFHNYLSVRSKLRDAILCYEPVNIDTIHRGLISEGYRYNTKDLFHFMDKKCITIKTTDKNVAAKRLKKR